MALIACGECGGEVSLRADSCPHCHCAAEVMIFGAEGFVDVAVRKILNKPRGELSAEDYEKVTDLYLDDSRISDACLAGLGKLPRLAKLHLGVTGITDKGLQQVTRLRRLTSLNLSGTQTSDAGLKELGRWWRWFWRRRLERLFLFNTRVTKSGVERLRRALPNCTIEHNSNK
ncbi:MAG: hypothetical protein VX705_08290 [Verrucomicrobiota bacterium]|nr:hypothetical protein [Verrucomicrobiota bacterium]